MANEGSLGHRCPFCHFAQGGETPYNRRDDVVYEDDEVLAFVSPKWWPNNAGGLIVIPKAHAETIYDIPDALLSRVAVVGKRLAVALKAVYRCDGTSLRQHNEPGGDQDVFHFHLHVLPRYAGDELYRRTDEHRFATAEERQPYAQRLRAFLAVRPT